MSPIIPQSPAPIPDVSAREALEAFVVHGSDADEAEFARRLDAYRAEVLREAEAIIRSSVASWRCITPINDPDHFKVIAAHAELIANYIRNLAAAELAGTLHASPCRYPASVGCTCAWTTGGAA